MTMNTGINKLNRDMCVSTENVCRVTQPLLLLFLLYSTQEHENTETEWEEG